MPKVSICCGVRNQAEWLREMIGSVMAQTMKDWELIVVDDGSTEDIPAVICEFAHEGRIRYHRFEENRGVPHGVNFAFHLATGEYIKALAADETLWPMALGVQATYLYEHPGIAACFGLPKHGPLGQRPEFEQYALDAHNRSRAQWLDTLLNLKNVPIGSCNGLWRRSVFETIGYFNAAFTTFCDHEWYCRLVQRFDIHMLPYRVAEFRDDQQSVGATMTRERYEREIGAVRLLHAKEHERREGLVTICIPVKDMKEFVLDAVRSVVAQTYTYWELIVVDDGSTDGTYDVLMEYVKECERSGHINIVRFPENKGDREACNYALQMAQGEYFAALSADDVLEPTYLERVHGVLCEQPLLDFCSTQTDFIGVDGQPFTEPHPFKDIEKAANHSRIEWLARLRMGNVYFGCGMFRTQALRQVGGWRQVYGVLSDYAMYLDMLQRGDIHVIEEPLTHTRITGRNASTNFDPLWLKQCYGDIKKRFYIPRRKIIVATPFYSVSGFSPYIYALHLTAKALDQVGVEWEYWHPSGDAYVQRVKNTIFTKFLEDPEATDLLMIDSDMEWEVGGLLKMLMLPEELIVGSYPQKNSWDKWTSRPRFTRSEDGKVTAMQKNLPDGGILIEGEDMAGGFMLVKRGILERYAAANPDRRYVDSSADSSMPHRVYIEFFSAGPLDDGNPTGHKQFWGEDRQFSRRLKEMGERWWIYANIRFGHWGMKGWDGCFSDYLKEMRSEGPPQASASQPLARIH